MQATKFTNALNASLSIVLVYMLSFWLGMDEEATTAATTVMIIATAENFKSSLQRGVYRVLGTLLGAVIGMLLIGFFPQERMLYLVILSLFVTFFMYLARAYQGDKTVFMLTLLTMMMVFKEGEIDEVFLYGINRTVMTVFGILIYTAVTLYLFPRKLSKKQEEQEEKELTHFIWFDIDDIKGSFMSFLIFWVGIYIWIVWHPPQGFYIVALATALSLYTVNMPISSMVLIVLFSISLIIAALSYVLILPNIHNAYELGIFLFVYSFIGFYFLNPQISIFYLIGLATFLITNQMNYSFEVFMMILLIFYMFLFILLFFDYIPFNTRPHQVFLKLHQRFLFFAKTVLFQKRFQKYAKRFLPLTVKKMYIYLEAIDFNYFDIEKESLKKTIDKCKEFSDALLNKTIPNEQLMLQYEKLLQTELSPLKESKF